MNKINNSTRRGFLGRMLALAAAPALAGYQINKLSVATIPSWFRHISVLDYGADPFGQRDSTSAARAAMAAARRAGKAMYVPPGNYYFAGR